MICRASSGSDAPPVGVTLQIGSGFSGECVRTGQLLHCEDSETDSRVDQQSCKALGVRSMIAAPVRFDGQVVGLLEVFSPQAHVFTGSDKDILQRLAEIVAKIVGGSASSAEVSAWDGSSSEMSDEDESGGTSRRTRLLLALGAAAVATVLALVVIPRVRSKIIDSRAAVQNPAPTAPASHSASGNLDALRKLADSGDAIAQFALGIRYATGDHVKQDYSEAAQWFLRAADHGEVKAQSVLAAYYWDGTGVPKDLSKAYFWAILARANGDDASKVRAAELAVRITPSERNAIEQQANEWLVEHGSNPVSSASK
jgi:hypothetical protein